MSLDQEVAKSKELQDFINLAQRKSNRLTENEIKSAYYCASFLYKVSERESLGYGPGKYYRDDHTFAMKILELYFNKQ